MAERVERGTVDLLREQGRRQSSVLMTRARGRVEGLVAERKDLAAARLDELAGSLRDTASRLEGQPVGPLAQYADVAAEQVDKVTRYLRERDLEGLFDDVQEFARRRPELFLGGTFLAGLLLARFLKSSGERLADDEPAARSARTA
ncbi:MAG TPA: hypothetical protein VF121_02905 [Thermoanaerobaculia bacterium]|nr:hypothetical protein [Thermoanaerobaculia bacterium]